MRSFWLRAFGVCALVVAAALIAGGCKDNKKSPSAGGLAKDQTLVWNFGDPPSTIDPALVATLYSANLVNQMFLGLTKIGGKDNELTYTGAEGAPDVENDGTVLTYHLRDMKWSNGDAVTAGDFRYGILRSLNPKTAAPFASYMSPVKGATEYNSEKGTAEDVGVEAVDDKTLRITLTQPTPWFDRLLALSVFYAMPQKTIEQYGTKWTDPKNIVVNGPFTMTENKPKQQITLLKNRDYYDAEHVTLTKVILKQITKQKSAHTQFKSKKIDGGAPGFTYDIADVDSVKELPEFRNTPAMSTAYIDINVKSERMKNPKVRKALALAVDRKAMVENITKRGEIPLSTFIPTSITGYDTIKGGVQDAMPSDGSPDIEQAKDLLAEAGWKKDTEVTYNFAGSSSTDKNTALQIQSDFAKVGVKMKLIDKGTFDALYAPGIAVPPLNPDVDMVSLGWIADYDDPQDFYALNTCASIEAGLNTSQWCNKKYDAALDEASKTLDDDARFLQYKQLEAMLVGPDGEYPAIPLYQQTESTLVHDWVKGYELNPQGLWDLSKFKVYTHS